MKNLFEHFKKSVEDFSEKKKMDEATSKDPMDLMFGYLKKHIRIAHGKWSEHRKVGGKSVLTWFASDLTKENDPMLVAFNFNKSNNKELTSVDFYPPNDFSALAPGKKVKSNLSISMNGTSLAYVLPIVVKVCQTRDFKLSDEEAKKLAPDLGESTEQIDEAPRSKLDPELRKYRDDVAKKTGDARTKWQMDRTDANKAEYKKNLAELKAIYAAISAGATSVGEVKMKIQSAVPAVSAIDSGTAEAQQEIEDAKNDYGDNPELAFKEMAIYVKSVIKGLNPGVIICGAPGLGKTFRILQQVRAAGYKDGENMGIIKGKITATRLYAALYEYKEEGQLLIVDDADSILFDPTGINIFKAALDSYDERKIMYNSPAKILDKEGEEIPDSFEYYGRVIVITNFRAGQLDSALKGRVFVQSLDFSTKQVMQIIRGVAEKIDPHKISMEAKKKSISYLEGLAEKKSSMEISLRTFSMCAKLYQLAMDDDDDELDEDMVKRMIKHQMANQASRGGGKF